MLRHSQNENSKEVQIPDDHEVDVPFNETGLPAQQPVYIVNSKHR